MYLSIWRTSTGISEGTWLSLTPTHYALKPTCIYYFSLNSVMVKLVCCTLRYRGDLFNHYAIPLLHMVSVYYFYLSSSKLALISCISLRLILMWKFLAWDDFLVYEFQDWGFEGYELLLIPLFSENEESEKQEVSAGDILSLKFVKSALTVNPCMVSEIIIIFPVILLD